MKYFCTLPVTFSHLNRHYIMSNDTFHTIILPLKDKLFRFAYSIVREQAEAEDITQDVLVNLWDKKEVWSKIENLEAYCFRATKNMAIDRLASMAIRKNQRLEPEKEDLFFVNERSPHHEIVHQEQIELIQACVDLLPETQKMVFQLREVEELSYKEIADSLDISEDLVKISLFRARKKMKELLSGYKNNEY